MTLDHVSIAFDGHAVLRDFSMALAPGSVSCLMGRSGSGKTTLLKLMLGFIKPDSGLVSGFSGMRTGVVFQEDRLVEHLSAFANVQLVTDSNVSPQSISDALESLGLDDPHQTVSSMSGGQRRRVAIVRAMLYAPKLLLLDEPFKALDSQTRLLVADYIRTHTEGATVLLIAHDKNEALMLGAQHFFDIS